MLVAGSVLAIEPMLTLGTSRTRILPTNGRWSPPTDPGPHAGHTVAVTEDGPRILTLPQADPHGV